MAKPMDLASVLMRLLRERLSLYKDSNKEQIIPNTVLRALRDDILAAVEADRSPERQSRGVYVMTESASMAESQERQSGAKNKNPDARPRAI